MIAWALCVIVALLAALVDGASRVSLNAVALVNGPWVLAACAALGVLLATAFRSVAAAPIAAGIVYVLALTSSRELSVRVLWDGGATASLWSLTPNPPVLIGSVAANVAIAVLLLAVTTLVAAPGRSRWVGPVVVAAVGLLVAVLSLVPTSGQAYYLRAEQQDRSTVVSTPATVESEPGLRP